MNEEAAKTEQAESIAVNQLVKVEETRGAIGLPDLPEGFAIPADWGVNDPLRQVITTLPVRHESYKDMLLRHTVGDVEDAEKLIGKTVNVVAFTCHLHNRTTQTEQELIDTVRTVVETDIGELYEFLALKPART